MASVVRTLAVNAAFLHEIKQDHQELCDLLDRTRDWLARSEAWSRHMTAIAELLAALRDQVALHFSLEEAYGYFEDALETAPRLSHLAETLRAQHGSLFIDLCRIVSRAERARGERPPRETCERLAEQVSAFCQRFDRHEDAEIELIVAASDDDLGCGD